MLSVDLAFQFSTSAKPQNKKNHRGMKLPGSIAGGITSDSHVKFEKEETRLVIPVKKRIKTIAYSSKIPHDIANKKINQKKESFKLVQVLS